MAKKNWWNTVHTDGPGLKQVSKGERWYGPGYCGICGHREPVEKLGDRGVVPVAVRYWDPDDGWRMGVLCVGCGEDCTDRGPKVDDYACRPKDTNADSEPIAREELQAMKIDAWSMLSD